MLTLIFIKFVTRTGTDICTFVNQDIFFCYIYNLGERGCKYGKFNSLRKLFNELSAIGNIFI